MAPHLDDAAGEVAVGHEEQMKGFRLGFGGPWDHGGGSERLGGGAGGEEKRMVVCLLGLGCAAWSLTFAVFIDAGHVRNLFSFVVCFQKGTNYESKITSDERNMLKYSITKYFFIRNQCIIIVILNT